MKLSKEIKVGFVAIFAIGLLVWGYNYLKGTNLFVNNTTAYAIYPKVPGLSVSSPIIINGVQSGVVDDIYFHPDKTARVIVKLNISEKGLVIGNKSVAELISVDFMGSKAIGIKLKDSDVELKNGDTLRSSFEPSMLEDFSEQMLPIKEKAENMMVSMDSAINKFNETMVNMDELFTDKNKQNLSWAIGNLKTTIQSFNTLAINMNSTLNKNVKPTMTKFSHLADSIKEWDVNSTLAKAQSTLDTMNLIFNKINNGEGTMGQLINNDSLYNNLQSVTKSMDLLLIEVNDHPKRFVHFSIFGRRDKKDKKGKPNN